MTNVYQYTRVLKTLKGKESVASANELLDELREDNNPVGYEIITPKNKVPPYFEYDLCYATESERIEALEGDLQRIKTELSTCYDLNKARVYIFASCGVDIKKQKAGEPCHKNSIHVILRGLGCFLNNQEVIKPANGSHDPNVYATYQKFRLAFCTKKNQKRIKERLVDGKLYGIDEFHTLGEQFEDYLITNTQGEALIQDPETLKQKIVQTPETDEEDRTGTAGSDETDENDVSEMMIDIDNLMSATRKKSKKSKKSKESKKPEKSKKSKSGTYKKFKTVKHLKALLKCLEISRIDNLKDWLVLMRICKNIMKSPKFDECDVVKAKEIIHKHMKKTPEKYTFKEVEKFLTDADDEDDPIEEDSQAGWGTLARMAKEDDEDQYLKILKKANKIKKGDIFNMDRIEELRRTPRRYHWSDYIKFKNKNLKSPEEVLKYFADTSFKVINGGKTYHMIYDRNLKKIQNGKLIYKFNLATTKLNPFQGLKNTCKFKIAGEEYELFKFSQMFFNEFYYMYSEMIPYAGAEDPLIHSDMSSASRILNKFEGFENARYQMRHARDPEKATMKRMLWHIKHIICDEDATLYEYVLSWVADILQNPGRKSEVCLLLQGEEGAGKNILVEILKLLIGSKYCFDTYDIKDITGGFNVHLSGKMLVVGDELVGYAGFKKSDFVKGMITSPYINITKKGVDTVQETSYHRYIFTTNNFVTLSISNKDRRICVIGVSSAKLGDFEYFRLVREEMDSTDNIKLLYDFLMKRDLSTWNFRKAPVTKLKQDMVISQLDDIFHWFVEFVDSKNITGDEYKIKGDDAKEKFMEYANIKAMKAVEFKRRMLTNLKCQYKRFSRGRFYVFNVDKTNKLLQKLMRLDSEPLTGTRPVLELPRQPRQADKANVADSNLFSDSDSDSDI